MCRPKHVEQLRNNGIINSTTRLYFVGFFYKFYITMHGTMNIKSFVTFDLRLINGKYLFHFNYIHMNLLIIFRSLSILSIIKGTAVLVFGSLRPVKWNNDNHAETHIERHRQTSLVWAGLRPIIRRQASKPVHVSTIFTSQALH